MKDFLTELIVYSIWIGICAWISLSSQNKKYRKIAEIKRNNRREKSRALLDFRK